LLQRVYVAPGADRGVPELAPGVGVKRVVAVRAGRLRAPSRPKMENTAAGTHPRDDFCQPSA
jgi:hypothetical protein